MLTGPNPPLNSRRDLDVSVAKLAILGKPGFNLEDMLKLLQAGLTVETLLDLIAWRLEAPVVAPTVPGTKSA